MKLETNVLYYGDNLDVLRKHIPDDSIDLIYLDPPFNSNRSYNVLFKESSGAASEAQIEAFGDTWHWGDAAQAAYEEVVTGPQHRVARMLQAMVEGLGHNDVTAYLTMMAIRLVELHKKLKAEGSIYLHCDPTAGSYLRVLMDSVFGPRNLRGHIVWRRFSSHGNVQKTYGRIQDLLLFYSKGERWTWNQPYRPLSTRYVETFFTHTESATGRRYRLQNVLNPNKDRPNLTYEWNGHVRVWKWTKQRMQQLHDAGLLEYSKTGLIKGVRQYLDDSQGEKLQDLWDDIRPIGQSDDVDLGYETQKPLALLERIVSASSTPGDVVLDPFCGCGTAVHAAQKLNRGWIGIDITNLAIGLIRRRMQDSFPGIEIKVIGEPVDVAGARELAATRPSQFEYWVLDKVDAQPTGGKGSDLDGVLPFIEFGGKAKRVVLSVKGTKVVNPEMLREVRGAMDEKKPIGVLITVVQPTPGMKTQAAAAGFYESGGKKYPKVQILTVADILKGKRPQMPPQRPSPFAQATKETREKPKQHRMEL